MLTRHERARIVRRLALTVQAWLGLVAFDLALLAGFAHVHQWLKHFSPRVRHTIHSSAEDIVWAVDEACVWYVKRAPCLQRSVIAVWLLRRDGLRAELVIGYRPLPFESHAWVEVDGQVVNDRPQYQKFFTVLDRL
ncbi:MAG TPA: lasso peptide biosynthesis B2 protein [Vicinamibacterales bacterium]|nr:lasso peptide biosynthesis B2 protein [Vicinamibacterales bacterium]